MHFPLPLRPALAAALLGAALNAGAAPAAAPITFDTTPRAGQHQRQTMDMQATMAMRVEAGPEATDSQRAEAAQTSEHMALVGPMKMAMQLQQTLKVGQPDAGGWLPMDVSAAVTRGQLEVAGKQMPIPNVAGKSMTYTARFNPRDFGFELQRIGGAPEMTDALRGEGIRMVGEALQLLKALQQRPLKIGDSVQVPLAMTLPVALPGGAGAMEGQLRYTLVRVERGVAHFDLGMDLSVDIDVAVPAAAAASAASAPASDAASAPADATPPKPAHLRMTGSGKGSSSLRLSDRLPLASRLAMDMQMRMDMPDQQRMLMDMNMVMQSKGESLARSAAARKKP